MAIPQVCPQLTEDNKCRMQENKPLACRAWSVGGKGCLMCRKLANVENADMPV